MLFIKIWAVCHFSYLTIYLIFYLTNSLFVAR